MSYITVVKCVSGKINLFHVSFKGKINDLNDRKIAHKSHNKITRNHTTKILKITKNKNGKRIGHFIKT